MTFQELHNLYTNMEKSEHYNGPGYQKPMTQQTKGLIRDFFVHLGRVYSGAFGISVTAIASLPAGMFLAWLFGNLLRWCWEVFLIGWR